MILQETPVATFAKTHRIPLFVFDSHDLPERPDFLVVAGFGKIIPKKWLELPKRMAINMHASLLPAYRGAFPAEWAILRGEAKTGVTLLTMSENVDSGDILVQKEITIAPDDTRQTLYDKLYRLGANLLVDTLTKGEFHSKPQPKGDFFYARRMTRDDGFVPWEKFDIHSKELETKFRALIPWPGVWTRVPEGKRLKLIELHPTPIVVVEGKTPIPWNSYAVAS